MRNSGIYSLKPENFQNKRNMKRKGAIIILSTILATLICVAGCSSPSETSSGHEKAGACNAIYYWKTQFQLDNHTKSFIGKHDIQKMYIRFFDIDYGQDRDGVFKAIPIATTIFRDTVPVGIEVVPTVYITTKAIKADTTFARLMYKRIMAMAKRNKIRDIHEIQVDCDWTESTQVSFFKLCEVLRDMLHKDGIKLSATIRLHQLKKECPPVDCGVLMLYNTGSLYNPDGNSILNYKDVEPYLKTELEYALPLDFAFPVYSWGIWMRKGEFKSILHKTDFTDTLYYRKADKRKYIVSREHYVEGHLIKEGDIIRLETSPLEEILKVKRLVNSKINQQPHCIVLYHLDSLNISQYSEEDIHSIYKR